jgi:hypothetical protein
VLDQPDHVSIRLGRSGVGAILDFAAEGAGDAHVRMLVPALVPDPPPYGTAHPRQRVVQVHTTPAAHDANVETTLRAIRAASRTRGFTAMKFTAMVVRLRVHLALCVLLWLHAHVAALRARVCMVMYVDTRRQDSEVLIRLSKFLCHFERLFAEAATPLVRGTPCAL